MKQQRQSSSAESSSILPWAAFLHFIDSKEDSYTLANLLDKPIYDFLTSPNEDNNDGGNSTSTNTVIAIVSDHGLQYGPYYHSQKVRARAHWV